MDPKDKDAGFRELFDFYYKEYKPLYCCASAGNTLPQEALFEVAAAFDHVARHYSPDASPKESESYCAGKALSHLKRACLDLYKLEYSDTKDLYDALCRLPINLIDNGEYEKKLRGLFAETKEMAVRARRLEGMQPDGYSRAFEVWQKVYQNCIRVASEEFYLNPKVEWAKRIEQGEKRDGL